MRLLPRIVLKGGSNGATFRYRSQQHFSSIYLFDVNVAIRGAAGWHGGDFEGPAGAHMLHLNLKAKRYSCRGGKYGCTDVLGFLRFDPSPEICSQTSSYSTSHWAHGPSGWWCIELRLHQILEKCCWDRYLKVAPFEPPFKTILESNLLT